MIVQVSVPNIVYILFRQKWLMAATFLGCMSLAVIYCVIATPLYEAESDLFVRFGQSSVLDRGGVTSQASSSDDRKAIIQSLMNLLTSDDLAEQVIEELGLDKLYPKIAASHPWQGTPLGAAVRRMTTHDLSVSNPRDSDIIEVRYVNPDPQLAQQATALLVDRFIATEIRVLRNPESPFLKDQLDRFRAMVDQAGASLEKFRAESGISSVDEERSLLLKRRADLDTNFDASVTRITELQLKQQSLQSALSALPVLLKMTDDDRDASFEATRTQLMQLRLRRQELLNTYRPDNKVVTDVENEIAALTALLAQKQSHATLRKEEPSLSHQEIDVDLKRTDAELSGLQAAQTTLAAQRDNVNRQLDQLDAQDLKLKDLTRQYQIADLNYRTYYQSVEEAQISDDLNKQKITTIAVVSAAGIPDRPFYPRTGLFLAMGSVLGLVSACALAFLRESIDQGLNLPVQVKETLQLPVLASLPDLREVESSLTRSA